MAPVSLLDQEPLLEPGRFKILDVAARCARGTPGTGCPSDTPRPRSTAHSRPTRRPGDRELGPPSSEGRSAATARAPCSTVLGRWWHRAAQGPWSGSVRLHPKGL